MSTKTNEWPRLSQTLDPASERHVCQACGKNDALSTAPLDVSIWREYDDSDKPLHVYIALCQVCSRRIIEPHPRLYALLAMNEPAPGAMPTCDGCRHRSGLRCNHPGMAFNGGPGVALKISTPTQCFLDGVRNGKRFGEVLTFYRAPVTCEGRDGDGK